MHISTARDMMRNTRQAAKSGYDAIVSSDGKTNRIKWLTWLRVIVVGQTSHNVEKTQEGEADQKKNAAM